MKDNSAFPGFGFFWLVNAINSSSVGKENREEQMRATKRSEEFQWEMERAREIADDERIRQEIAFKRAFFDIQRNNRQKESAIQFSLRRQTTELDIYLKKNWPLAPELLNVFLEEIEDAKQTPDNLLNVILMHSSLYPAKENDFYETLEYLVEQDIPFISDVKFHQGACLSADGRGGNATIMNIHFLLSALPTLVISPRCLNGKMMLNAAVWEPLSARPFMRPLFSIPLEPEKLADKSYSEKTLALMRASVDVVICVVRDSYMMLTQGKNPQIRYLLSEKAEIKKLVSSNKDVKDFIYREMDKLISSLSSTRNPKLLDVYSESDINYMAKMVESIKKDI